MGCSNHSKDRMKERLGLNNKAAERLASIAYEKGISHSETSGSLHNYITYIVMHSGYGKTPHTIKVYGRQVYIFNGQGNLITVFQLQKQYEKAIDKLMKKKQNDKGEVLC